jgi:hypothetical protein
MRIECSSSTVHGHPILESEYLGVFKMKKNKNFIHGINIHDGIITFNDFDINEDTSFGQQKYSYKEDMLQVAFGDRFILDVEHDPKGYRKEKGRCLKFFFGTISSHDLLCISYRILNMGFVDII